MLDKKPQKSYIIASPLEGILTKGGTPIPNAKIIRILRWPGNQEGLTQEFSTDSKGVFKLPAHEEILTMGLLTQFVSSFKLVYKGETRSYDLWYNNKFDEEIYSETGGKVSGLVCDINEQEIVFQVGLSRIMTVCRWNTMPNRDSDF